MTTPDRPTGPTGESPFDEPEILRGEIVDDGESGFRYAGRSRFSVFSALGGTASGQDLRRLVSTPLRILAVALAVPSIVAVLLSLAIDSDAKVVGYILGGAGIVVALFLERRRRTFIAPSRAAVGRTSVPSNPAEPAGVGRLAGLLLSAALLIAVTAGFDLLAVLLLVFNVW